MNKGYTKQILREAMKGILPESTRLRKSKIGFANPINEWLKKDLKSFVLDQINSRTFLQSSIWNGTNIRQIIEQAYQYNDIQTVRSYWEFLLASRLMDIFKPSVLSPPQLCAC